MPEAPWSSATVRVPEKARGLTLPSGDSEVRGLALYGFDHAAIHLLGGSSNVVEANYVGVVNFRP